MFRLWLRRISLFPCLTSIVLIASLALAQEAPAKPTDSPEKQDPERQHAMELYNQGKMVQAMPLLEKVFADHPNDIAVCELWGNSVLGYSYTLTDPDLRKKARMRARSILLKAKELGDDSNLIQTLLAMLPEDGSEVSFSAQKEVDDIMKRAEADFARGDYEKAREGYSQALLLDPTQYYAALFSGDTYFKEHKPGFAGSWFARAIEIDPNRETAYRYWGDSLTQEGKMDDARTKFIQAIVAEPYNQSPWVGVKQWADANKVQVHFLHLKDRGSVSGEGQKINITIDSSMDKDDPSMAGWLVYNMSRAGWRGDKFKKEFPNEPKYRHTLREEADALHLMVTVLTPDEKKKKKTKMELDPSLVELIKIDQAGLIEPFALLNRADNEIAMDYEAYRNANRDKIFRYLSEFVVPPTPK
jgi:Tfp pilus assembly protein PilF